MRQQLRVRRLMPLQVMRQPAQRRVPERWLACWQEQVQRPSWCLRPVPQVWQLVQNKQLKPVQTT